MGNGEPGFGNNRGWTEMHIKEAELIQYTDFSGKDQNRKHSLEQVAELCNGRVAAGEFYS